MPRPEIGPDRFRSLMDESGGRIPPLYIGIDYSDAPSVYEAFMGRGSILLDSVKGPFNIARYSFICFDPFAEYTIKDNTETLNALSGDPALPHTTGKPLTTLRRLISMYRQLPSDELPPFQGGAAGMFCYDFVRYLERVPSDTLDDLKMPDAHIFLYDRLIALDHKDTKAWAIVLPGIRAQGDIYGDAVGTLEGILARLGSPAPSPHVTVPEAIRIRHDTPADEYRGMVSRAKEYIASGDIFQANLSLRVSAGIPEVSAWALYRTLREINPSPFAGFLDFGEYCIASSSPERLVKVRGRDIETRPIAGTRPRNECDTENERMRQEMLLNEKERAEHIMLIDLERNDIGKVCDYGSVHVDELMTTEDYSHVMHIVSNVRGRLAPGKDMFSAIRATFPGGTITGVPKVRCMEIIDELERFRRGPYTGSFGYMGYCGNMDLNIIIRTFAVKDGRAYVQAGAGIVADSEPQREYMESLRKAEALIRTLERCSGDPG